jgi:hypothetical protein
LVNGARFSAKNRPISRLMRERKANVSPIAHEAIQARRNEPEMHMIGHQAAGPDLYHGLAAAFDQQIALERIIGGFKDDRPAAIGRP